MATRALHNGISFLLARAFHRLSAVAKGISSSGITWEAQPPLCLSSRLAASIKEDSDPGCNVHYRIKSTSPISRARLIGKNPGQLEGQHTAAMCGECVFVHTQSTSLCSVRLRYRTFILIAMAVVYLFLIIIRLQTDESTTLKQDTTPDHSSIFEGRKRVGEERDSRRRFFRYDFCTSYCRYFSISLQVICRHSFGESYMWQSRRRSRGWQDLRGCKPHGDIGTLRKNSSALQ
jgi:hypothetical protein